MKEPPILRVVEPLTEEDVKTIWLNVLFKAVEDFTNGTRGSSHKSYEAYQEAREWIWSGDEEFPSFLYLCEYLELDSRRIRRKLSAIQLPERAEEERSEPSLVESECGDEGDEGDEEYRGKVAI